MQGADTGCNAVNSIKAKVLLFCISPILINNKGIVLIAHFIILYTVKPPFLRKIKVILSIYFLILFW